MIYVIDEMMGRGKSSAMINFVNSAPRNQKFIYIVPYNTERQRVIDQCRTSNFKTPEIPGVRLNDLKQFVRDGHSVVCTHKLFSMFDDETFEILDGLHYTLIMDEVIGVMDKINVSQYDADVIFSEYATKEEDGKVTWHKDEYEGKLEAEKFIVKNGDVYAYTNTLWYSLIPERYYNVFDDVYIMTYMFEHQLQRAYFDLKGIEYQYRYVNGDSVDNYTISEHKQAPAPVDYDSMIHIIEDADRLNDIGRGYFDLSAMWHARTKDTAQYDVLQKNIYTFFRRRAKTPSKTNMWTCFSGPEDLNEDGALSKNGKRSKLSGNGYSKGFIACNAKGTNEYRHKTSVAYCVNRFMDPCTANFLRSQGVVVNEECWALQELLQFLFRSAIRDGKPISVYIPSRRMRELLTHWKKEVSTYGEMRNLPVVERM